MESGSQRASGELNMVDDAQSDERYERFGWIAGSHIPERTVYPRLIGAASLMGIAVNNLRWSHDICWAEEDD